jgi:hypothetical protein
MVLYEASFFSLLLLPNLTGANWVATGDAERTKDRQTDRKLGPDVLGTQVEMHNPSGFFSLLFSSFTLLFSLSLFFKALLFYSSLKPCF